jgi:hypothetical protein
VARPTALVLDVSFYEAWPRAERRYLNRVHPVYVGPALEAGDARPGSSVPITALLAVVSDEDWDQLCEEQLLLVEQAWALWLFLAVLYATHDEPSPRPTDAGAEVRQLVSQLVAPLIAAPLAPPRCQVALLAA